MNCSTQLPSPVSLPRMRTEHSPPVVVAEVIRSGFVEGHHHGSYVVLNSDGSVQRSAGYLGPIFPRSSNKLMQATAMIECGFDGPPEYLALAAASHDGEPVHVATVREILGGAGLDESYLQTPADWPYNEAAKLNVVRAGGVPEPITMNCSGKHSAMLATCVARGWSTDDYRAADHPLQLAIAATMERMCGEPIAAIGVDGCGASRGPSSSERRKGLSHHPRPPGSEGRRHTCAVPGGWR